MFADSTLIPGAVAPVSNRSRRKFALSWSTDERQFTDWLLVEWNKHFRGVAGGKVAYRVRGNTGAAVRFYRRLCQMDDAERFSQDDIAAAIAAYASNPANLALKPPAWRYFKDWIDEAEDRIAAECQRTGRAIGSSDKVAADAQKIITHLGLDKIARSASNLNRTIGEHIDASRDAAVRIAAKSNTPENLNYSIYWQRISTLRFKLVGQSKSDYISYLTRAADRTISSKKGAIQ
jgi:hypothetical protein